MTETFVWKHSTVNEHVFVWDPVVDHTYGFRKRHKLNRLYTEVGTKHTYSTFRYQRYL